jgi:hypothetical protein
MPSDRHTLDLLGQLCFRSVLLLLHVRVQDSSQKGHRDEAPQLEREGIVKYEDAEDLVHQTHATTEGASEKRAAERARTARVAQQQQAAQTGL